MNFHNHYRNCFRRICYPEETISRITANLKNFGVGVDILQEEGCRSFHWCRIDRCFESDWSSDLCISNEMDEIFLILNTNTATNGKGASRNESVASGLSEFVERLQYSIFYDESNSDLIDLSHLSDLKYYETLCKLSNYHLFGMRATAFSLNKDKNFAVPFDVISFLSGTNGLASGNTIEEAIIQGSCEIFERYSASKAIRNNEVLSTFDKRLIKSSYILDFMEFLRNNNIETLIKDISCDLMPSVGVLFYNKNLEENSNPFRRERCLTFQVASSFSFEEAISRCLSEYLQNNKFEEVKYRYKADNYLLEFQKKFPGVQHRSPNTPYTVFRSGLCTMDITHLLLGETIDFVPKVFSSNSVLEDIKMIEKIGSRLGSEVLIVDITDKVIDFPTVRVIIPRISDMFHFGHPAFSDTVFDQWKGIDFENFDLYHIIDSLTHRTIRPWLIKYSSSMDEYCRMISLDIETIKRFVLRRIGIGNWVRNKICCTLEDRITEFYSEVW